MRKFKDSRIEFWMKNSFQFVNSVNPQKHNINHMNIKHYDRMIRKTFIAKVRDNLFTA